MGADAWRPCPRCFEAYEKETEAMELRVEAAYGNVTPEEYIRLLAEYEQRPEFEASPNGTTLREDYGIITRDNGVFQVSYHCECHICGFKFEYKHTEIVYHRTT